MLPMNKQVELYEMLMELLKAEEKCRNEVRDSQNEVNSHHMFLALFAQHFLKYLEKEKKMADMLLFCMVNDKVMECHASIV